MKCVAFSLLFFGCGLAHTWGMKPSFEGPPIHYSQTKAETKLTALLSRVENGELDHGSDLEKLERLLRWLSIPIESQVLVFSKTSAQKDLISPVKPRAIYYSDDVYVGWVQGGDIEVISFDKTLGMVFHRVKLTSQDALRTRLVRDNSCLSCHTGSSSSQAPSLLVRSIDTLSTGNPIFKGQRLLTDHRSPIKERWGGWYVTGETEGQVHMGNLFSRKDSPEVRQVVQPSDWINEKHYLYGGSSDIVSLMVLEHQLAVHNALVEGNLATRITLHRHRAMRKAFDEPLDKPLSEVDANIIHKKAKLIVKELLFKEEFQMEEKGVSGDEAFVQVFSINAKRVNGRSLKDLRLYERLFKHRCSYMVYSEAFGHLPPVLKAEVLSEMKKELSPSGVTGSYMSESEKSKISKILEETLPSWGE